MSWDGNTLDLAARLDAAAQDLHRPVPRQRLTDLDRREAFLNAREAHLMAREAAVRKAETGWGGLPGLLLCCLLSLLIGATLLRPGVQYANRQGWFGRAEAGRRPGPTPWDGIQVSAPQGKPAR